MPRHLCALSRWRREGKGEGEGVGLAWYKKCDAHGHSNRF